MGWYRRGYHEYDSRELKKMKKCKMTSEMIKNAEVGAGGYGKKAWNHFIAMNKALRASNIQGRNYLTVVEYRAVMGYPVWVRQKRTDSNCPKVTKAQLNKAISIIEG